MHVPGQRVLFAGPLGHQRPARAAGRQRHRALGRALRRLRPWHRARRPRLRLVGRPELLARQRRFLTELRRQVGYHIARAGRSPISATRSAAGRLLRLDALRQPDRRGHRARLPRADGPGGPVPGPRAGGSDPRPHALVLIGDQPHEPGHIEEGLQPVFEATGVVPHFTVDVKPCRRRTWPRSGSW